MKRSERGFTLVEIMIVVAIIALLAAIAIPNVLRGRTTANETAAVGNLRALVSSLEMYRSVNQVYPALETFQNVMYTTANPAFGPPSFNLVLNNGVADLVQGYIYDYTGATAPAGSYSLDARPENAGGTTFSTGTRRFRADQTGLTRHCSCAAAVCAAPADWTLESTIDAAPTAC